jgi:hypothetical protein
MQRILVNVVSDGTRARRRGREEVEDVLSNGMARACADEDVAAVAALLLGGVQAAALDRCGGRRSGQPNTRARALSRLRTVMHAR